MALSLDQPRATRIWYVSWQPIHHVYGWYKPSRMGLLIFFFNHIKFVYLKLLLWYDVFVSLFLCLIVYRFAYLVVLFLAIAVF